MTRPADTVVVIDEAGEPRQVHPVDAKEIVANGGSYEVTEKDMAVAAARDDGHPVGTTGYERIEEPVQQLKKNVEALSGPAAMADPKFEADAKAGQEANDGDVSKTEKADKKKK